MLKIKRIWFYVKLNLLWLFKYHCKIPTDKYHIIPPISKGDFVAFDNARLRTVKRIDAKNYHNVIGIVINKDKVISHWHSCVISNVGSDIHHNN